MITIYQFVPAISFWQFRLRFRFYKMEIEHIRMINDLEEQGCLVAILDRYQTAGLKSDEYGYVRYVMMEAGQRAINEIGYQNLHSVYSDKEL